MYKSYEKHVDEIRLSDVTLTFVREKIPKKLFKKLTKLKFAVEEVSNGIYYISGYGELAVQVVVTAELDSEQHIWINSLTSSISEEHLKRIISTTTNLKKLDERNHASSVWEVVSVENREMINRLRGNDEANRSGGNEFNLR